MDTIQVGVPFTTTLAPGLVTVPLVITTPGKYVFLPQGATAIIGVWDGPTRIPHVNGVLRIEPGQKRGVRTFHPGPYTVSLECVTPGAFTLLVRQWSFWDYFG
jgi:hypothetical protein